jgi:hypothetical protein
MRRYFAVVVKLRCPSSSWMVRMSVPCSKRWTAKACRSECGVIGLEILQIRWAAWHSFSTANLVMCRPGKSPGKSQSLGFSTRHQARRISRSFGESMMYLSDVPRKVMCSGPRRNLRRQAPGSDCPAHNYLPLNEAMSLSAGRKKPRFRVGGRTASSISRFCEGSVRRYTSVL